MKNFHDLSYKRHSEHFEEYGQCGSRATIAQTWMERDTVDAWRHQRMYRAIAPVLSSDVGAKWLTVGDGRYGKDAQFILENGGNALASDISETLLKEAKDRGYIREYRQENAESLSFNTEEFDYVFCKEAYHHFPRPAIALYEMLRVAKKAVLLIEPNDPFNGDRVVALALRKVKNLIRRLLGRQVHQHGFEESGNYVFSVSRRGIEKIALGLNYRVVAFKGVNDAYIQGVEYEKVAEHGPLFRIVRKSIGLADFYCKVGLKDFEMLALAIFKQEPEGDLLNQLASAGWDVVHLPINPYATE